MIELILFLGSELTVQILIPKQLTKCFKHGKLHLLQKNEMDEILWEKMYFFIHLPQGSVDQLLSCLPIVYRIKLNNIGTAGYWQTDRKECIDLFLRLIPSRGLRDIAMKILWLWYAKLDQHLIQCVSNKKCLLGYLWSNTKACSWFYINIIFLWDLL